MKRKVKERDNKKIIIITIITIVILVIILAILSIDKDGNDEFVLSGWMKDVERIDYVNIPDFGNNKCNNYYSPTFRIKDNNLYDYNDVLIREGVFTILNFKYGDCDSNLIFISTLNGKLYYVNIHENEKYKKYETIEINEVYNIVDITNNNDDIIAIDYSGTETVINEYINEIIN